MASLLGDLYGGFVNYGVGWYDFMYELYSNINRWVLIDTGGVI